MAVPPRHLTETAGRGISPTRISRSRALSLAKAALRKMKTATAQHAAGIAAQTKSAGIDSFMPMEHAALHRADWSERVTNPVRMLARLRIKMFTR
jgi:hypothetical protein